MLASDQFRKSSRLQRLLTFVVESSPGDEDAGPSEHQIGVALFDRRPSYDTGSDNIVRVYVSDLRKRLEMYYEMEGASDSVKIGIPRGSYKALYQRREPSVEDPRGLLPLSSVETPIPVREPTDVMNVEAVPELKHTSRLVTYVAFALLVAVSMALGVQSWRLRSAQLQLQPWKAGPATASLWQDFVEGRSETIIVLADTAFALAQDLSSYQFTLQDYLDRSYLQRLGAESNPQIDKKSVHLFLSWIATRNSGSISDFRTARRILALDPSSSHLQTQFAKDFTTQALRHDSSVIIGGIASNPWVGVFQDKLSYRIEPNPKTPRIEVKNTQPKVGEPAIYATSSDPNRTDGFCVIALLPNPSGEGKTLIIAGTDSQATEAGGDFITQESSLESLEKYLGGDLSTPFQVLLKTSRLAGSPISTEITSARR